MGPRRAVLVSSHYFGSKRRAGFHHIAEALRRAGWHVTVMTVGFSHLSRLKLDHRFAYGAHRQSGRLTSLAPDLDSYVWFTPFHPLNRLPRPVAWAATPVFARYGRLPIPGSTTFLSSADLIVFESTAGLMLLDRIRARNPAARFVYRVSDDLEFLHAHDVVRRAEARALPGFDLVSVPSAAIFRKLEGRSKKLRLQHHGIDKALFESPGPSPYGTSSPNAVFVGTSHLDRNFLATAAGVRPDVHFHVVGPLGGLPAAPNIHAWGELPFAETVPFVAHADVGLAIRTTMKDAESLSDSLKVIQYTYARLPIIAPEVLGQARPNVVSYRPGDVASVRAALDRALLFDRSTISRDGILSWDELAAELAGSAGDEATD